MSIFVSEIQDVSIHICLKCSFFHSPISNQYKTEFAICVGICAANALECDGVVYFCDNVRDIVLVAIGSFRVWIAWMVGGLDESMLDLVRLAIGSWSPLELIANWVFFGILSNLCCTKPMKIIAVFFSQPPL